MWRDPFPAADLHFYSNIFHGWPADRNAVLVRKSFDALPCGGRIVLHEVLYLATTRAGRSPPPDGDRDDSGYFSLVTGVKP
ncbi:hypothetical protein WT08_14330 [Burkholderia sp. MSMB1552]|nr:hypothetical protein WT08_14330 [Burkholderia sp. MSMB1552]KWZ55143.1 hypothetical protein WS92_03880 [Burkholderia sp. MSMB1588]